MAPYPPAFKHQVKFTESGKPETILGDVVSFQDGCFSKSRPLAGVLMIHKLVSIVEYASKLVRSTKTFYLGINDTKETNKGLIQIFQAMKSGSQYALCYYDKLGSEAIFVPFSDEERGLTGYKCGFLCKIINDKNEESSRPTKISWGTDQTKLISPYETEDTQQKKRIHETMINPYSTGIGSSTTAFISPYDSLLSSTSYNPTPSTVYNMPYNVPSNNNRIPSSNLPTTQPLFPTTTTTSEEETTAASTAAQSHYNQLKRNRETRHQSQLFHLRNLNNFIKVKSMEAVTSHLKQLQHPLHASIVQQSKGLFVLDLACGKGGDVMKWWRNEAGFGIARYVGADIAEESLREFVTERILPNHMLMKMIGPGGSSGSEYRKITHLIHCNLSQDSLTTSECLTHTWSSAAPAKSDWKITIPLTRNDTFHIISCQFAMHYMFSAQSTAQHFFSEVSNHLQSDGYYVGTTIDCRILTHYLVKGLYGPQESAKENKLLTDEIAGLTVEVEDVSITAAWGNPSRAQKFVNICFTNEFGKRVLTIRLTSQMVDRLLQSTQDNSEDSNEDNNNSHEQQKRKEKKKNEEENNDSFGIEYRFILQDSEDENAVNAPEWLVPIGRPFDDLLQTVGLRVKSIENFHEFLATRMTHPSFIQKMQEMEVFNIAGRISDVEWNIARLYCVIIIEKPSSNTGNTTGMTDQRELPASYPSLDALIREKLGDFVPHSPPSSPPHMVLPPARVNTLRQLVHFTQQRHTMDCPPSSPPLIQPGTPSSSPPPNEDEDDEEEEQLLLRMAMIRSKAQELFGGDEDAWDRLDDTLRDKYLSSATRLFDGGEGTAMEVEVSPYD